MLTADAALTDLDTVRALERKRITATGANDVATLAALLDDKLIYINSAGGIYDKKHYLSAIETGGLTYDKDFDVHETECRAVDGIVVLVGVMLGHSRLDGEQQVFHSRCISVWRKYAGDWKMIAWQSSPSHHAEF